MLLGKRFTEVSGREEWVTLAFCGGHFYCILFVRFLICVNVPTRFLDMANKLVLTAHVITSLIRLGQE